MKQHISITQLNELSEKGKERLRKWYKPVDGDLVYKPDDRSEMFWGMSREASWGDTLPLLSIGQMIQFLQEHKVDWINEVFTVDYGGYISYANKDNNLIDDLWELVKDVLEK